MSFSKLNQQSEEADRRRKEERDRSFRRKVAIQQFINHNAPLFHAMAKGGVGVGEAVEGEVMKEPAEQAARLALLVAAKLSGKPYAEVTPAEARPFRTAAAEWAASRWAAGKGFDPERAATEIVAAVRLADGQWDSDPWKDDGISPAASLMMTAAAVAGSLARQVEVYDFRLGREAALGQAVRAVVARASATASEMLGAGATEGDQRNLIQTLARNLSSLMEACYERKAREVVALLNGRPEQEKIDWYGSNAPLDDVIRDFGEWAVCLAGYAVAATRDLDPGKGPDRRAPESNQPA